MLINKRIGNSIYIAGKFETNQTRFIFTRNYFNFMLTVFGYGVAILRHI